MRGENLKHIDTTGMIERKSSRGKQREKMLDGLTNWLNAHQVTDTLKVTEIKVQGKS